MAVRAFTDRVLYHPRPSFEQIVGKTDCLGEYHHRKIAHQEQPKHHSVVRLHNKKRQQDMSLDSAVHAHECDFPLTAENFSETYKWAFGVHRQEKVNISFTSYVLTISMFGVAGGAYCCSVGVFLRRFHLGDICCRFCLAHEHCHVCNT